MKECKTNTLATKFSLWEKIYAQSSFVVMGVSGTIGIILEDWRWVVPYVIIYWYGIPGIVMRYLVCPRCPHLHLYGDCLQAPTSITKWLTSGQKFNRLSTFERFMFLLIFIAIPIYPIYWLLSNIWLLTIFLISTLFWYGGQYLYFCRKCRVKDCPFNRAAVEIQAQ